MHAKQSRIFVFIQTSGWQTTACGPSPAIYSGPPSSFKEIMLHIWEQIIDCYFFLNIFNRFKNEQN
jgi:hypothetical protein